MKGKNKEGKNENKNLPLEAGLENSCCGKGECSSEHKSERRKQKSAGCCGGCS